LGCKPRRLLKQLSPNTVIKDIQYDYIAILYYYTAILYSTIQLLAESASKYKNAYFTQCIIYLCLQCFDAVGWAAGRASGL